MGGVAKLFEFFQTFYQIYNNPAFKQLVDVLLKLFEASKAQTVTESELKACVAEARAALDQIEANAGQTVLALNAPPPMSLTMP